MEYSLILVLISVVVLAALLFLGPNIGNVFSEVNSSLGGEDVVAEEPKIWTHCASENGFCSFSGTESVRYGATGIWFSGTFTDGVACTNGVFGDPTPGIVKSCEVFQ